jgi:hypothetical protein
MTTQWRRLCVVLADEIEVTVMEEGGKEHRFFKTHKYMSDGKVKGKNGPLYPGRPRGPRILLKYTMPVLRTKHLYTYSEAAKAYFTELNKRDDLTPLMMG